MMKRFLIAAIALATTLHAAFNLQAQDDDIYFSKKADKKAKKEAEKNEKENAAAGDTNPGFLPRSRVLVRVSPDEKETILCKGVLDYTLCSEGVVCSNGKELLLIRNDGSEKVIAKAEFAEKLSILSEDSAAEEK